jgi:hypothetical protein
VARSSVTRTILGLTLAGLVVGCASDPPPGPDTMTAPMTAAQARAEFEATKVKHALPDGAEWTRVEFTEGTYGPYAGAQLIEWQAMCAWFLEARAAKLEGDQARFGAALTVLEDVPSWRSFSDAKLLDETGRAIIREGVEAAFEGDFAGIGPFLQANCTR